jgi:hypothetical protein
LLKGVNKKQGAEKDLLFPPPVFLPDGRNVDQRLEIEDRTDDAIFDPLSSILYLRHSISITAWLRMALTRPDSCRD